MSKYCPTAHQVTPCTENCKDCAKDIYRDLKQMFRKAEYVSEDAIKSKIGDGSFELVKQYGFIETCGVVDGTKVYAL